TGSVLQVWQQSKAVDQRLTLHNVLLLTDFSEFSERALDYAIGIARRYGARLHLLHFVDPTPFHLADDPAAVVTACEDARRDLERRAGDIRQQYRARSVDINVLVKVGELAAILPRMVKDLDVGLILVGTHGRTGWKKFALGSVTEIVIDRSPCPVMTVGP